MKLEKLIGERFRAVSYTHLIDHNPAEGVMLLDEKK